ncbi:BET1-like protein isoform X2 [Moschus berezovskii]|uniref:BET1-like protein isoform X2 n=1 Tax=Moschus berezovskii TaxID=68408 RepID=UPI002443A90F|nr:BET1-like protein isoform X2 [Moschus berezovskii]
MLAPSPSQTTEETSDPSGSHRGVCRPDSAGSGRPQAEGVGPEAASGDCATSEEAASGRWRTRGRSWTRWRTGLGSPGAVEEMLDRENKRMADSLASKVTRLKSLALDIDRDAEDQNRYLDGMDSDFTSMTGLLTGSVKRFSTVARSGRDNRKLLCGVAVGLLVAFFILAYLLSRARA